MQLNKYTIFLYFWSAISPNCRNDFAYKNYGSCSYCIVVINIKRYTTKKN